MEKEMTIRELIDQFHKVVSDWPSGHKQAYAILYGAALIAVGIRDGLASINKPR